MPYHPGAEYADVKESSELLNIMMIQAFICGTTRMMVRTGPVCVPNPVMTRSCRRPNRLKFPDRGGKAPGYGDTAFRGYFYSYPSHVVTGSSEVMPLLKASAL